MKKERCCGFGHCECKQIPDSAEKFIEWHNAEFEKQWSYFLKHVENPEQYMTGKIKESCRLFHRMMS